MKEITNFKLGELYCGPGGLAYDALNSKSNDGMFTLSHAWANDNAPDICETYRNNICPDNLESVLYWWGEMKTRPVIF